jgi:hypothetical protein
VALVFSDRSLDRWLNAGGVVDPGTYRMHDLSDAIAIPGLHPWSAPWTGLDATAVTLGKDGVASHYAGLGDRLATALTNISTWLTTHTHASNGTASALPAPTIPVVASSTVKVTE